MNLADAITIDPAAYRPTVAAEPWMAPIFRALIDNGGGVHLVRFGAYRPDLVRVLAKRLAFPLIDFRTAIMTPKRAAAHRSPLSAIDRAIRKTRHEGIVLYNIEALMAAAPPSARRKWFQAILERRYSGDVIVPLAFHGDETPDSPRVVDLDATCFPEQSVIFWLWSNC